ncbi:MAG: DCC1-like thiol-disulfide oxidoreductase family protein, partial [Vicinamibacterales bacterium]
GEDDGRALRWRPQRADVVLRFVELSSERRPDVQSSAALFVAGELGWPWKAAVLTRILPRAMLDRVYDLVARTRYRVFGRFEHCLSPRPEFKRRFIDG